MKISILTTITNPTERQDKYIQALQSYCDFADEVVVVNGGKDILLEGLDTASLQKIKIVNFFWAYEWNWIDLPRHLNYGLQACTGDWIMKMDIDQVLHERNIFELRDKIENAPADCESLTMQKATLSHGNKWFQKGEVENIFRNRPEIKFGKNSEKDTDLCFPVKQTGLETVFEKDSTEVYHLPVGTSLKRYRTGVKLWNYDYFFKTQEFARKEFWRFSRAYNRYFGSWVFGDSEEESFKKFLMAKKDRHDHAPYNTTIDTHPKYMRKLIEQLTPDMYGYNAWGLI